MIEIRDTCFQCNSCGAKKNVRAIIIGLELSTQKSAFSLCPKCRKKLKGALNNE